MGCTTSSQVELSDRGRGCPPDPGFAKLSKVTIQKRENAVHKAEAMFAATRGKHFHTEYCRTTLVSYGASCKVLTAVHRSTGKRYAAKAIPKDPANADKQYQQVLLEVGVMKEVEDHPNAVTLIEAYNEARQYYLVMEYCEGGELFEHISKSLIGLTERQAAQILRSIMQFLVHMHSKGISHMDIKPENIMFDSEGAEGVLKIIDFGASVFIQPDEQVRDAFGTVRYSSPEMANDYGIGQKTDIWSAGVVMYVMLCGSPPFIKSSDIDTLNYIKKAPRVKFTGSRWGLISSNAKDCIRAMLDPDPRARPSAAEVLQLPWLQSAVPDNAINSDILSHLRAFANQSRMRRLLLGLMAANLTGLEANRLLQHFYMMDVDSSGTIELPELVSAARKVLPDVGEEEVVRVFSALDVDHTGSIDVHEFFAGLLHTMDAELQSSLAKKSFTTLDTGSEGVVRLEVFVRAMVAQAKAAGLCDNAEDEAALTRELEAEFRALDINNDGVLSFEEYKAVLSDGTGGTTFPSMMRDHHVASVEGASEPVTPAASHTHHTCVMESPGGVMTSPVRTPAAEEGNAGVAAATPGVMLRQVSRSAAATPLAGSRQSSISRSGVYASANSVVGDNMHRTASARILSAIIDNGNTTSPSGQRTESGGVNYDPAAQSHQNLILLALELQDRTRSGHSMINKDPQHPAASRTTSGRPTSRVDSVSKAGAVGVDRLSANNANSVASPSLQARSQANLVASPAGPCTSLGRSSQPQGINGAASDPDALRTPSMVVDSRVSHGRTTSGIANQLYNSVDGKEAISAIAQLLERQRVDSGRSHASSNPALSRNPSRRREGNPTPPLPPGKQQQQQTHASSYDSPHAPVQSHTHHSSPDQSYTPSPGQTNNTLPKMDPPSVSVFERQCVASTWVGETAGVHKPAALDINSCFNPLSVTQHRFEPELSPIASLGLEAHLGSGLWETTSVGIDSKVLQVSPKPAQPSVEANISSTVNHAQA